MKKYAIVLVYYRSIPNALACLVNKDGNMSMVKDGVHRINDHSCPRLSIYVYSKGDDKKRLKNLLSVLEELQSNNQIVKYSQNLLPNK